MIGYLTGTVATPVWMFWAGLGLILLAGLAGWFWRRSATAVQRQRAVAAEREAKFLADLAESRQPATDALTRVVVASPGLPPRDATVDVTAIAVDYPPLDLSDAYDVYGTDDGPEEPDGEDEPPPSGEPVAAYHAAVLPRYDWSDPRPWPAHQGVMPDRWSMLRWRVDRWSVGVREAWVRLRSQLRERWEAASWEPADESPWAPMELSSIPRSGQHRGTTMAQWHAQAVDTGHRPRHGFDEVPPSIAVPLALMTPTERARELVRQLGQSDWWPVADRRLRSLRAYTFRVPSMPILGCAP